MEPPSKVARFSNADNHDDDFQRQDPGKKLNDPTTSTGTKLPLSIASRIATFHLENTSQLARFRYVSRQFYRSLLDHTIDEGFKHFVQCPCSDHSVYTFIDATCRFERTCWFEVGDIIRPTDALEIFDGCTVEKFCILSCFDIDTVTALRQLVSGEGF
jgi:hypothetical protein